MNLASREFNAASQDDRDTSDLLTRRLYLHGIAYLLQGLPGNLTDEEALSLRYVMPQSLMDTLVNHPQGCTGSMVTGQREPQQSSSILQRIIAGIVVQMFIITQLLLPYVRLLVGQAYRWECQHKAGQRLVCTGIRAAKGVGRRTLQVSQAVRQMNDGKVGWAIDEAALWWIQGLIGGIQQRISGVKLITMDETYMASSAKTE
ncbi:uncharacterized protein EI97DRAFT_310211 [Westerdykella ornata]|uniref:Uncharacterized protein n=1 Tax=Westerdykella ornata TaxID=318751 RepID=A0A6A6JME0_WESOR|nr:uncharacterized protein EI97DRAFT_310211 [Westerdykella ornata]KAF2277118.1 hypothetical protein EI97DRAFT_310211 [Westerdykella ornata]